MTDTLEKRATTLANDADRRFVLDPWLKEWRKSPFAGIIPNNHFSAVFFDAVEQLHKRGMEIIILESADPETKVGFIAFERAAVPVVHYAYVKPVFRGMGFFPTLLAAAGVTGEGPFLFTFRTPDCKKFRNGSHCPAIARRKDLEPIYAETPGRRSTL